MRKFLIGPFLLCGMIALAQGQVSPGNIDTTLPDGNNRDTLLLDTRVGVDPPAFAVVSSAFTDDVLGGFQTAGADDFTVPLCGWEINRIRAYGHYQDTLSTGSAGPADSVNVYIIPKTGSTPTSTNMASIAVWSGTGLSFTELDLVSGGDFEIDLPSVVLPQGDYWLVVQANIELFSVGQWNWTESSLTPNSGTTNGDESAWFQSAAGVASPVTGTATCVATWGQRVTGCSMTRNPDSNPPTDRDFAFQIEGNALVAGVTVDPITLTTTENGSTASYGVVLDSPPSTGETVTVTPSSNDVTEGTVSGALVFDDSNWDVEQFVTVTPGAAGDGNDGDVAYTIDNAVASSFGGTCYSGAAAASVAVTNANIDGIATIIVDPTSSITVSEDGTVTQVVTIEAGPDVTPAADVTINLTNNSASEVSLSAASAVLTAGNGYSTTVTITGVADDVVEAPTAFSITTETSVSGDAAYNGVDPTDISGEVTDSNTASVTVTPSATPLATNEAGATATISYVLTAQPTANVTFTLNSSDPSEASVAPTAMTFTNANWNVPQVVTVTGLNDSIDDGTQTYRINSTTTASTDPFWVGKAVASADGENADDADTFGITVSDLGGVVTSETGTTDTFTVVLNSEPLFDVSIDFRSGDTTEGLVGPVTGPYATTRTVTFTAGNWNTAQTIEVQGQDDDIRADGNIAYTIFSENVASGDPLYDAIADGSVADIAATNNDDADTIGLTIAPGSIILDEDSAPAVFTVRLDSEPTATVTLPISSGDTTEATVSPASLVFTSVNWATPQNVTVTPVLDSIVDTDVTFDITVGPATGGNYAGQSGTVSTTVNNIDVCEEMTLDVVVDEPIIAYGTPSCVFDLYCTNGSNDPADWTFLGTHTVGGDGSVNTGQVAGSSNIYVTTITGTFILLTTSGFATVPTLGEWGMIAFVLLLAGAGMYAVRRRAQHA